MGCGIHFGIGLVVWSVKSGGGLEGAKRYVSQGRCSIIFLPGSKYECAIKGTWCGHLVSSKIQSGVPIRENLVQSC